MVVDLALGVVDAGVGGQVLQDEVHESGEVPSTQSGLQIVVVVVHHLVLEGRGQPALAECDMT